jgi:hypothetical protein
MPRRLRTGKGKKSACRNFCPEFEGFLAGDDTAFTDAAVWALVSAEPYFADAGDLASLTPAEQARYDMLLEEQRNRREAGELAHYRGLAAKNGFAQLWAHLVGEGISPDFAFARCQSQGPANPTDP